jgi:hypothetical protein
MLDNNGGTRKKIPGVKRAGHAHPILCAHCGSGRLLPLTVSIPRAEYLAMRRMKMPVQAQLKCLACGHRHVVPPKVLLTI